MIGRTSGASKFNIHKFSEELGLRGMEKVVSTMDDFVIDRLFYLSQCRDLSAWVICLVWVSVIAPAREANSSSPVTAK